MSDNNVNYVNFKYIILPLPKILLKICHCYHTITYSIFISKNNFF